MRRLLRGITLAVTFASTSAPVAALGANEPPPSAEVSPTSRELAKQWFATAVSLARAGRYEAAKLLFLEAYAVEPHHIVLYNIAQAERALGDFDAAARHLRRYLAEGGDRIPLEQRGAVERDTVALEAEARNRSDVSSAAAQPARSEHSKANPELEPARWPGYALVGGGLVAIGTAAGLYVYNHDRYLRWQRERRALIEAVDAGTTLNAEGYDAVMLRERAARSNELLKSIQRMDPIPIATASAGMAALGFGLWRLFMSEGKHGNEIQMSGGLSQVELRASWKW